ncbi:MAG: helix-turn-helix domain-containing protein [Bacteroidales bacterium]|jgi:transcriptional regulator with XRE-family HTH domain
MENRLIKLKIQNLRKMLGYTQESMASKIGMSTNSYSQIERGKTLLVSNRLFDIAKALNTTPEELILGSAPKEDLTDKIAAVEIMYKERIAKAESENKIARVELEAEIQRLRATLESKDSIIGLLKESLNRYNL